MSGKVKDKKEKINERGRMRRLKHVGDGLEQNDNRAKIKKENV